MLTIIIEDSQVHQGLFPGPGTTQNDGTTSNKQPKSEFEWTVAHRLFSNHEAYADVFTQSTTSPKGRSQWVTKIKNRLNLSVVFSFQSTQHMFDIHSRMCRTVEECSEMMGETGQGYKSEEEIKEANNPKLTRTWGEHSCFLAQTQVDLSTEEVKKKCPWYFTLK